MSRDAKDFQESASPEPFQFQELRLPQAVKDSVPREAALRIELGKTVLACEQARAIRNGTVLALDAPATAPVDILADERLVARGEIVVLEDQFCVSVTEILELT
ncbi:MAG: FliM/FliN family flagellar motor switch protein [Pirellulaceae bacterium]